MALNYADMTSEQKRAFLSQVPTIARRPRQCEHIKANGEFCGSPALRGRNFCYFHLTHIGRRIRAERAHARARLHSADAGAVPLELPPFEDADAIQVALMQVVDAILHNRIDNKRAGLVLYALQTASSNLAKGANFEEVQGTTVAGRYDDFEKDFELEDTASQLKIDESGEAQAAADEHAAKLAQLEELANAYVKLDAAEQEVIDRSQPAEGEEVDNGDPDNPGFRCSLINRFFCSMMGPMSGEKQTAEEESPRCERPIMSQRVVLPPLDSEDEAVA